MIKTVLTRLFLGFLILFTWEHIGSQNNIAFRPSPFLNMISKYSQNFFHDVGVYAAVVSSWLYTWIEPEKLMKTFRDLAEPLFKIAVSGVHVLYGYAEKMHQYKYPLLVLFGTMTILGLVLYLCKKKPHWFKWCRCCKRAAPLVPAQLAPSKSGAKKPEFEFN
jgi:hypothetical protein